MRLFLATLLILIPAAAVAGPDDDARARVAVELALLSLRKPAPAIVVPVPVAEDVPTDLSKPAPAGWEKVSFDGGRTWQFRKVPGVTAPSPFGPGTTTPGTPVRPAGISLLPAPAAGSFAGSSPAATFTNAPSATPAGTTDCVTGT